MDLYTKAVLTVIAGALVFIGVQLSQPGPAQAVVAASGVPTVGELARIRDIENVQDRLAALRELAWRVPLVRNFQ